MNKRLSEAIERLDTLSEERQQQAALLLLDFLENDGPDYALTPQQMAELERRLAEEPDDASDEEVPAVFDRLTK
jgi:hypothetical protein